MKFGIKVALAGESQFFVAFEQVNAFDDYSQRLIPAVPYPTTAGIQTIIDHLAKTRPEAKNLKPQNFIDASILKEIEDSGFVKKLYAN